MAGGRIDITHRLGICVSGEYRIYILDVDDNQGFEEAKADKAENGWEQFKLGVFHELILMVNVVDMVFGSMEIAEQLPQESINYLTDPKNILLDTAGGQNADLKACLESIDENLSVKDRISRQIDCYLEKLPPAIGIQKEVAFELADFFFDCDSVNFRDGSYNLCWHRGGRVVGFILPFFVSGGQNATSRVKNITGVAVDASEAQKALKILNEAHQSRHVIEKPIRGKRIIRNSENTITMTREEHGKVSVVRETPDGITNIFRANADEIAEAATRIKNHRVTNNLKGGNLGYLEGTVNGKTVDNKMWRSGEAKPEREPQIFKALEVEGSSGSTWLRNTDSEYKMLNNLADDLGGKAVNVYPNISGELKIISENPYCKSCQGIIQQFNEMFPNIKLILIDGAK